MKKNVFIIISVLVLVGALLLTLTSQPAAPSVVFTTLDDKRVSLASMHGKMVLVNFWATSCPGCVQEMPKLAATYRKFQSRGLVLVAVAMSYDPPEYVRNYARQRDLPFAVALDASGEVARAFSQVKLTPTTFLIDKQGHIVQQTIGELDFEKLDVLLEHQLGGTT